MCGRRCHQRPVIPHLIAHTVLLTGDTKKTAASSRQERTQRVQHRAEHVADAQRVLLAARVLVADLHGLHRVRQHVARGRRVRARVRVRQHMPHLCCKSMQTPIISETW